MSNLLKRHTWWAAAAAGLFFLLHLAVVFSPAVPEKRGLLSDVLVALAGLAAAGLLGFAAWRLRQSALQLSRRLAVSWLLFALALICNALGDFLWLYYQHRQHTQPFPSLADAFYLLFYPLFLAGILRYPSHQSTLAEWLKASIDMLIVLLSAILVFWNFILGPVILLGAEKPLLEQILALAYPTGDLVLLWVVLVIIYRIPNSLRQAALWLLALGLAAVILTDSFYVYQEIQGTFQSFNPVNLGYTASYLAFALAGVFALRQVGAGAHMDDPAASEPLVPPLKADQLLFLPYGWSAVSFLVLVLGSEIYVTMNTAQIISFVGSITALVVARQFMVLHENARLSSRLQDALNRVRFQAEVLSKTNLELQNEIIERRRAEERLTYDALHDSLTGLPNRALYLDRLSYAARKRQRNRHYLYAVLFLDLDGFKLVNDSLGHNTGDHLLVHVARVLSSSVRMTDTVARLGGDEFVILLEDFGTTENVLQTAHRLQEELGRPIQLDGKNVTVSASIGVVLNVAEYDRPEDVLRDADLAMYQAKSNGKRRFEVFNSEMRASILRRLELESELRQAMEREEFVLHYQPIFSLPEHHLTGFEALVRWQHPTRGLLDPSEFISVAEETGLIVPLGRWILYMASRQANEWRSRYAMGPNFRLSVNVSGRQLTQLDFVNVVADALELAGLPPRCLALEVTESVCLDNVEPLGQTLLSLQQMGVEIQIDDFGTGYSSLSYLQRLPIQSIKIDKSFVQAISANGRSPNIIHAILSMAHNLGIKAVAEGIETESQVAELNRLQCNYAQGFLFARPMDSAAVDKWLIANRRGIERMWM